MDVPIKCICPPRGDAIRHPEGDTVTLRDKLALAGVQTLRYVVKIIKTEDPDASTAVYLGAMSEHYILVGVEAWTVVDDKGKPVDVTPAALRELLLTDIDASLAVADVADELYLGVMLPLLQPASASSPPTPTADSTSQTNPSSLKPPKRSRRSSISTIPTADTVTTTTSLDGDSNSSPSSATAA